MASLLLIVVTLASLPMGPQQFYQYGNPEELRGIQTVFVDTGPDLKARDSIVKEIQKKLPSVSISDSAEGAEILLLFSSTNETTVSGVRTIEIPGTDMKRSRADYDTFKRGVGYVVRPVESGRGRILLSFEGADDHLFAKPPAIEFARSFIKAHQKANSTRLKKVS